MNGRLAKKLRKAVGFHPADNRDYAKRVHHQIFVRDNYRGMLPVTLRTVDTRTNSVGSPRYEYQQSKRRSKS